MWVKARESEGFRVRTDEEVSAELVSRLRNKYGDLKFTNEQLERIQEMGFLLQAAPHIRIEPLISQVLPCEHIDMPFGGYTGTGYKVTCRKCGLTVFPSRDYPFAEFVATHAGCE